MVRMVVNLLASLLSLGVLSVVSMVCLFPRHSSLIGSLLVAAVVLTPLFFSSSGVIGGSSPRELSA